MHDNLALMFYVSTENYRKFIIQSEIFMFIKIIYLKSSLNIFRARFIFYFIFVALSCLVRIKFQHLNLEQIKKY